MPTHEINFYVTIGQGFKITQAGGVISPFAKQKNLEIHDMFQVPKSIFRAK